MHWIGYLVALGAALVALELIVALLTKKGSRRVFQAGVAVLALSWMLYAYAFVACDFSLESVWEYASVEMPPLLRLASTWCSAGGSLFLLSLVLALALVVVRTLDTSLNDKAVFVAASDALLLAVIALAYLNGAFKLVWEEIGQLMEMLARAGLLSSPHQVPANGLGLNPLLQSVWVYPHPLSTFAGYGVGLLAALLYVVGDERKGRIAACISWILLTAGIVLGAYWTYEAFGWGGYWGWDPIEIAELIPWLLVTALLHARFFGREVERTLGSLLGFSIFYSIFIERGGLPSYHGFITPSHVAVMLMIVPAGCFLAFTLYLVVKRSALSEVKVNLKDPIQLGFLLAICSLLYMWLVLCVSLLPALLGLTKAPPSVGVYNALMFPAALAFLAGITMCMTSKQLGHAWRDLLIAATIIGAALALLAATRVFMWAPLSSIQANAMAMFLLPYALAAMVATLVKLVESLKKRRAMGLTLLHLGLAILAIGVLLSGTFATIDYLASEPVRAGSPRTMILFGPGGGIQHVKVRIDVDMSRFKGPEGEGVLDPTFAWDIYMIAGRALRQVGIRELPRVVPGYVECPVKVTLETPRGMISFDANLVFDLKTYITYPKLLSAARTLGRTIKSIHVGLDDYYIVVNSPLVGGVPLPMVYYVYAVNKTKGLREAMTVSVIIAARFTGKEDPMEVLRTAMTILSLARHLGSREDAEKLLEMSFAPIQLKYMPLVNLVWIGAILMMVGGAVSLAEQTSRIRCSSRETSSKARPRRRR